MSFVGKPASRLNGAITCLENPSHNPWYQNPELRRDCERDGVAVAIIGYARVSTTDLNPLLQLDALEEAGATRIFTDYGVSGATASRPHLDACLDHLREGDVLTVWKLDRRGRNKQHVLAVVDQLTSRGIGFRSLTEGLHTDGPMGKAMHIEESIDPDLERFDFWQAALPSWKKKQLIRYVDAQFSGGSALGGNTGEAH
jgi:Resolvase, N terminal domain